MHTWKTRVAAAVILAVGMATTIATSPIDYSRYVDVAASREDGGPSTVLVLVDPATGAQSSVRVVLELEFAEDPGVVRVIPDDDAQAPIELTRDTSMGAADAGPYTYQHYGSFQPIVCHEGGEHCSHMVTVEPTNAVSYELTGHAQVSPNEELPEDARVLAEVVE